MDGSFKLELASPDGQLAGFYLEEAERERSGASLLAGLACQKLGQMRGEQAAAQYAGLLVPCCGSGAGAGEDLSGSAALGDLLEAMLRARRPLCAVGHGVAALLAAPESLLQGWNVTGACLLEALRAPASRPGQPPAIVQHTGPLLEEALRDRGLVFTASEPDQIHVVVDRGQLVTAQNATSTALAVYNFIWLASNRRDT